jgi:tetratricopeptide (TPR) repeat protein
MFGKENLKIDDILEKRLSQERELQPDADERGVTDAASVTSSSLAPPGAGKTPTSFQVRRAEEMRALFRDIKDQAQQAFQLFKKNDPKNRSVLFALSTKLLAEGCENPLKSSIQQNFDIILDADFLQEVAHQVTLTPDEVALHANLFFGRFFAIARKCVEENRIKAIGDLMRLESTIKSILKPDELALLQQHLILEKRISGMTRENAAFAHQMLGPMGLILEELPFAERHARLACELAPDREDNWLFLAGIFYAEKRSKEVFSLSEKWLQRHKTGKSYHCLALAAAQDGDWKRTKDYVIQGLKIDPKSPRLLLSEIVTDLMLENSAASLKKAKERLISFHMLLQKEPNLSELVDRPDIYLISIVVYALNNDLNRAQGMLDTMLQEQPSREEFQKLRQILGVSGLQPPGLLKP